VICVTPIRSSRCIHPHPYNRCVAPNAKIGSGAITHHGQRLSLHLRGAPFPSHKVQADSRFVASESFQYLAACFAMTLLLQYVPCSPSDTALISLKWCPRNLRYYVETTDVPVSQIRGTIRFSFRIRLE